MATELVVTYDMPTTKTKAGGIFRGAGAPTISAPLGSLYIRTDPGAAAERLYINTDGATTWASFTASA